MTANGQNLSDGKTLTNGSSIDLRFPGSGSKDGFEHSTCVSQLLVPSHLSLLLKDIIRVKYQENSK